MKTNQKNTTWEDLVFRFRNHEYGAYRLRREFGRHTFRAFLITALGLGTVIGVPSIANALRDTETFSLPTNPDIILNNIDVDLGEDEPEPEPEPVTEQAAPAPPPPSSIEYIEPEVVDAPFAPETTTLANLDTVSSETVLSSTTSSGTNDPSAGIDFSTLGQTSGTGTDVPTSTLSTTPEEFEIFRVTEAPTAVNLDAIKRDIQYPQMASDNGISGTVTLRVLVDEEGRIAKHKIIRSPHPWLTQEIERHISKLQFTPALMDNRAVRCWVTVPFRFQMPAR